MGLFKRYRPTLMLLMMVGTVGTSRADEPKLSIQNARYLITVDPRNGTIHRIYDQVGKLELIHEPRLADNWKFSLPLPGKAAWQATEANYILGKEQKLTSHEATDDKLVMNWAGPLKSVTGRTYDNVSATMTIELVGPSIQLGLQIRSVSPLEIGEVYYPILGGTLGLGETAEVRKKTQLVLPGMRDAMPSAIFHTFGNFSWLGVIGPEQFHAYPTTLSMPWMELHQPTLNRSVYLGAHDPIARYKVAHLEMLPGIAGPRAEGNWPRPEELNGLAAGVKMCFVQFPYQANPWLPSTDKNRPDAPSQRAPSDWRYEATPVVLRFHDGDWREAAAIYRDGFVPSARPTKIDAHEGWMYRASAIQQVGPVPFEQLPHLAKAAAALGVKALLLTNWKIGGTDNGIPRFEADPKHGSAKMFADALAQCHALGVKVAVVINLQPVSQLNEAYDKTFRPYVCLDRWGIATTIFGWFEGSSLTGGFGAGERRVYVNPGHPGMRKYLVEQCHALAQAGVDGLQLQDFFACPLDFNTAGGMTADRMSWEGGLACMNEILAACRGIRPDFAISTDSLWDRAVHLTQVSSAEANESCPLRVALNTWQPTFTVADEDSLNPINDALRCRGRLSIRPSSGNPAAGTEPSPVSSYLPAVLGMREVLAKTLVDGESIGAEAIRADAPVARNVFRDPASGVRTAVLVNPGVEATEVNVTGFADASTKPPVLWQPHEGARPMTLPARITIPMRHLCIITEEPALERLASLARCKIAAANKKVVFDFVSDADIRGWTLEGAAFGVGAIGIVRRPTLNSLVKAGEPGTGTALSPPFTVEPRFERMELVFHGGWSQKDTSGAESLAVQIIDAANGTVLEQITPPGTHELTEQRIDLAKLKGKSVRLKLVDRNTGSSFAWIGVRRVSLVGPQTQGK